MSIKKSLYLFLGVILIFLHTGCGDQVKRHFGLITNRVEGKITMESKPEGVKAFIVAEKHRQTFFETSTGYLRKVTAELVYPDEHGYYSVKFENDVETIKLHFIARGFLRSSFIFNRSLGVGKYSYEAKLQEDPQWKRRFFLMIKPYLSAYITEKRYKMKNHDQLFLGNWINETEKRL